MQAIKSNCRAEFVFAGNSIFTLVSKRTGHRFTYGVRKAKNADVYFVNLLVGPNNMKDYMYLGIVKSNGRFALTEKSRNGWEAQSVKAISWFLSHIESDQVEMYHAGRCGRCRRRLTVPESIISGIGPECAKAMGR